MSVAWRIPKWIEGGEDFAMGVAGFRSAKPKYSHSLVLRNSWGLGGSHKESQEIRPNAGGAALDRLSPADVESFRDCQVRIALGATKEGRQQACLLLLNLSAYVQPVCARQPILAQRRT